RRGQPARRRAIADRGHRAGVDSGVARARRRRRRDGVQLDSNRRRRDGARRGRSAAAMSRTLRVVFAAEALVAAAIAIVALDLRAHFHVQDLGGVNAWGYRGPVMPHKLPNEVRIAVAGGDLAFGWGVAAVETLPYFVRRIVALDLDHGATPIPVTAGTLSARGLEDSDFADWIGRFAALQPDVVCVLADPPSHPGGDARYLPNRRSWFFQRFGYSPILPLVAAEKAAAQQSRVLG